MMPVGLASVGDVILRHYVHLDAGEVWGSCLVCHGMWGYKPAGALGRYLGFDVDPLVVCRCGDEG